MTGVCVAIATGFYLSYIPEKLLRCFDSRRAGLPLRWTGSGFVGTLLGWAALYVLPIGTRAYVLALLLGGAAAVWTSTVAERELGVHDDPRIVIDEVLGYWVTVAFMPRHNLLLLTGFVLFRFFDSVKLPPYRWLEDLPKGWGVVMDDVGAGVVSNLCLRALGHWIAW